MNFFSKIAFTKIVLIALIIGSGILPASTRNENVIHVIEEYESKELTRQNLAYAIKDLELQHPVWVYKQAMLESGRLKSRLCTNNNNLFGMKMPRKRETFATGKGKWNYAKFEHWVHSVADYKLYQGDTEIKNYENYLRKRKYAEIDDYVNRLKHVKVADEILEILNS